MSKITDNSFLFQSIFGTSKTNPIGSFRLSQLNSGSMQAQLRAAGINTNSKQYKAAIKEMMQNGNGAMYTNIQCIKNSMKCYDKDGDYIDPTTGLAGLLVTEENASSRKRIISIPESSKDEMFEQTRKEFIFGIPTDWGIEEQREDFKNENIKFFQKISGEKTEQGRLRANTTAL